MKSILTFLSSMKKLSAVLGIVSLFIAAVVRFFFTELTESVIGLLILALFLLIIYVIGAHAEIVAFLRSRRGRYGLNTLAMIIIFILIMIGANYLGIIKHRRFDVTASSMFTLAPQTVNVIKGLKEPVEAIGFFPDIAESAVAKQMAGDLLEEYRFFNKKLSYRFVDPESNPALAGKYKVRYHGAIVFVSGDRQKVVLNPTEQSFTNALLEVTGTRSKTIYFLTGSGEGDADSKDLNGYSEARQGLIRDLYQIKTLNLTMTPEIPDDCAVLIMAGTRHALRPRAKIVLKAYLKQNGKLFVLIDPNPPSEINEILADWGIIVGKGHVVDKGAYAAPDMSTPAVFKDHYPPTVITAGLDTTYFPNATSIDIIDDLKRVLESMQKNEKSESRWPITPVQYKSTAILPAVLTTPASRLEREGEESKDRKDIQGPLAIGVMVVAGAPVVEEGASSGSLEADKLTRLVVIGDSDFASNLHIRHGGNNDLFLNAVNWLAEEEHLIDIRPKQYSFRKLLAGKNAIRFIRYSSIGLLPLLIAIVGGIIWWRKR